MRLFIAEKPSLARALAEGLAGRRNASPREGVLTLDNGDRVTWCLGHLLELAEPHAYDPAYQKWRKEHLPIVPCTWQYQARTAALGQLKVVLGLIKQASTIVHVGDPDREGQLLVDEVLRHSGLDPSSPHILRCLINDLTPDAVRRSLQQMQPNRQFAALSASALARSHADWLVGINLTRLCSIQGQAAGFHGVLSVGRVQTPVLALVVARDKAIAQFVRQAFFTVQAELHTADGAHFTASWQPNDACQAYCDSEGRLVHRGLADNIAQRISGQQATVESLRTQTHQQKSPLPFNLSSLQIEASKRLGFSAADTLAHCQALYEKHQLITYPRSDCRYLPEAHWASAQRVSQSLLHHCQNLTAAVAGADWALKSAAWQDSEVGAHHAIIPTDKTASCSLSTAERQVYELIARAYLAQFYGPERWEQTDVGVRIVTGLFTASAKKRLAAGFTQLLPHFSQSPTDLPSTQAGAAANSALSAPLAAKLPPLTLGQPLQCSGGQVIERETSPPKPYTDASLIAAMTGIARHVSDPALKRILRETDGLGTEATRASILELLQKRGFITRRGKMLESTATGQALIQNLPTELTTPDMTAHWESALNAIAREEQPYADFMQGLMSNLKHLVETLGQRPIAGLAAHQAAPSAPKRTRTNSDKKQKRGATRTAYKGRTRSRPATSRNDVSQR
jgi:DNA topoisomerase III